MHGLPRRLAAAALLAGLAAPFAAVAWADTPAFTVQDPAIVDVTGLTRDPANNLYWLVQPGEEPPPEATATPEQTWGSPTAEVPDVTSTVYGVDETGAVQARLTFAGATPNAASLGFFSDSLYIADIADPGLDRDAVTVYGLPLTAVSGDREVPATAFEFSYPDGPHDAAALLIRPDGQLLFATTAPVARLYAAPLNPSPDTVNRLEVVANLPDGITDGLYLSDDLIAVRTAAEILVLETGTYTVVATGAVETAGEALALSLDGTTLLTAADGAPAAIVAVDIPLTETVVDAEEPEPSPMPVSNVDRQGTLVMLVAACFMAVIAGVLAFLRR
ncbi:MAG: hypothetical protein LBR33_11175 [Propionibacteriaceae bacterium]|nr:hypothetical protein [Propionibacteriaceae bacterium]